MNDYIRKILEEIKPQHLYLQSLARYFEKSSLDVSSYKGVYILAIGKAASLEAKCLRDYLKNNNLAIIKDYLIITKEEHSTLELKEKTFESSHPYVSEKSFQAAALCREFLSERRKSELVFALISGGASALVEEYEKSQSIELKEKFNQVLDSGINIDDLNHLRKLFSKTKNGRLVENCKADIITFLTSDIPDNKPFLIGSSPTLKEKISEQLRTKLIKNFGFEKFQTEPEMNDLRLNDKYEILIRYENLMEICQKHTKGKIKFTQKAYNESLDSGWKKICDDIDPRFINISFGELNINVQGNGKGGRNTHFVLFMANKIFSNNVLELEDSVLDKLVIFSVGTDGGDGPTDAAGAWISREKFKKLKHEKYLKDFDSYNYFERVGSLIKSGPTGTNLMDLRGIGLREHF